MNDQPKSPGPLDTQYRPLEIEERIIRFWETSRAFAELRRQRAGGERFRYVDGPVTANNPMGVHHAWGRMLKDAFHRFAAMNGKSAAYQNGFDCQGLWVEVEVERGLGFHGKADIEAFGLDKFSRACRERVQTFAEVIAEQSTRLGQWMDWENSYYTHDDANITGIWYFLQKCREKGYLYRGHLPLPWCTRCGTSLAQHEMMGSYVEAEQPAVYVTAPLTDGSGRKLVLWTTTPWTLAANTAAAVNPELPYLEIDSPQGVLVMSGTCRRHLKLPESSVVRTIQGKDLVGLGFTTFFPDLPVQEGINHRIVAWEDVAEDEGSGIVHLAPACGPEDFELSKKNSLDVVVPIDGSGHYLPGFDWLTGENSSEIGPAVIAKLRDSDRLLSDEMYTHSVPICWRCKSHVVYRLVDEWFIAADPVRQNMLDAAASVHWQPPHMGKRMADWLTNMGDWNISRKRFWGLPLPFYPCIACDTITVIGSREELRERAVDPKAVDELPELHRPWIDEILIHCPTCQQPVQRVPEVGDCWLDAGITPFTTLGYFDNRAEWEQRFPAEWVCEMREQVRLWFYSMLFMGVVLENRSPYQRVLAHERVVSETGEKFSKTGYMIRFDDAVAEMGADPIRYLFARQPVANECRFGPEIGAEARRRITSLWNIQSFFLTYAQLDDPTIVDPGDILGDLQVTDRWLMARTATMVQVTTAAMTDYQTAPVLGEVERYLEEVSNWYVRVNRRRFWNTDSPSDKNAAYAVLFHALRTVTSVLAPIVPFVTEQVWQNAIRPFDATAPESVHQALWPTVADRWLDGRLLEQTTAVRAVLRVALRLRADSGMRVRQPLRQMSVVADETTRAAVEAHEDVVRAELNIRDVAFTEDLRELETEVLAIDFRRAGPVLRSELGAFAKFVEEIPAEDHARVVEGIRRGEPVRLHGWDLDLPPEIFLVKRQVAPGFAIADPGPGEPLVGFDLRLDEELRDEGVMRDVVRHVQVLRRESGLEVSDRISLGLDTEAAEIRRAIDRFSETISSEVLAIGELSKTITGENVFTKTVKVSDKEITITLRAA